MASFFAVEADLRARIESALPGVPVKAVRAPDMLDTLLTASGVAVGLIYDGYEPIGDTGWGAYVALRQKWWAVVVVQFAGQSDPGQGLRDKADEALTAILASVAGARPEPGNAFQYHLASAPGMQTKPGWAYITLSFSVDLNFSAAN